MHTRLHTSAVTMSNISTGNLTDGLNAIYYDDAMCESGLGFIPSVFVLVLSAIIASAGMVVEKRAHIRLVDEGGKSYNYCCDKLWVSREVMCRISLFLSVPSFISLAVLPSLSLSLYVCIYALTDRTGSPFVLPPLLFVFPISKIISLLTFHVSNYPLLAEPL